MSRPGPTFYKRWSIAFLITKAQSRNSIVHSAVDKSFEIKTALFQKGGSWRKPTFQGDWGLCSGLSRFRSIQDSKVAHYRHFLCPSIRMRLLSGQTGICLFSWWCHGLLYIQKYRHAGLVNDFLIFKLQVAYLQQTLHGSLCRIRPPSLPPSLPPPPLFLSLSCLSDALPAVRGLLPTRFKFHKLPCTYDLVF